MTYQNADSTFYKNTVKALKILIHETLLCTPRRLDGRLATLEGSLEACCYHVISWLGKPSSTQSHASLKCRLTSLTKNRDRRLRRWGENTHERDGIYSWQACSVNLNRGYQKGTQTLCLLWSILAYRNYLRWNQLEVTPKQRPILLIIYSNWKGYRGCVCV